MVKLDNSAGSPAWGPRVLMRHQLDGTIEDLAGLYAEWENWAAEGARTHTIYPVLMDLRSPHPLHSWLVGLLAVMDAATLQLTPVPPHGQQLPWSACRGRAHRPGLRDSAHR